MFVPGEGPDYVRDGIEVSRFPFWLLPSASLPFLFERHNGALFLKKLRTVGIDPMRVAVCHAHTPFFAVCALALKRLNPNCRALLHHHSPDSFGLYIGLLNRHSVLHRRLCYAWLSRLHSWMDLHVCVSRAVARCLRAVPRTAWTTAWEPYEAQFRGLEDLPPPRLRAVAVLYNGVDTDRFSPSVLRRRPLKHPRIGCVANFAPLKRQLMVLKALERCGSELGDWTLRFIGDGPEMAACGAFVKRHGWQHRVSFEAPRDPEDIPAFFREIDLFVLPSVFEAFGCVFAEAWAAHVPFICCDTAGVAELIPEGCGDMRLMTVPPDDLTALASRMIYFCKTAPTFLPPPPLFPLVTAFLNRLARL